MRAGMALRPLLGALAAIAVVAAAPDVVTGTALQGVAVAGAAAAARPSSHAPLCTAPRTGLVVCTHEDPAPGPPLPTDTASLLARAAAVQHQLPVALTWLARHRLRLSLSRHRAGRLVTARDTSAGTGSLPLASHTAPGCIGDGTSGDRVQVVYAVPQGRTDRFDTLHAALVQAIAHVDDVVLASAAQTGGALAVRWVTNPDCTLNIARAAISSAAETDFSTMRSELVAAGFNRTDRKYLVLVDTPLTGICGLGQELIDDRPTGNANDNDSYSQFARVDAQCWDGTTISVEAHELVHTLGGVQPSAPDATPYGHCTDDADTMCYVDGPGVTVREVCPPANEPYLDCNHDDYFSTAPPPGSYLATHWNTAQSSYLAAPPAPAVAATAPLTAPAGQAWPVSAASTVASGEVAALSWSASGCTVAAPTAPATTVTCPATDTGPVQVSVTVRQADGQTAVSQAVVTLGTDLAAPVTPTIAGLPSRVDYGRPTSVDVTVTTAGVPVAGLPLTLSLTPAGSTTEVPLASLTSDLTGRARTTVTLRAPGTLTLRSAVAPAYAPSVSTQAVGVRYHSAAQVSAPLHAKRRSLVRARVTVLRQDGLRVGGARVVLYYRSARSASWHRVGVATTTARGIAVFRSRLSGSGYWRAAVVGTATLLTSWSTRVPTRAR